MVGTVRDMRLFCVTREDVGPDIVWLGLVPEGGDWPPTAPGQFYMLEVPTSERCFALRRPFSLHDLQDGVGYFLFRRMGFGTRRLGSLRPGEAIRGFGPLGRPFPEPTGDGPVGLISGGLGMATLYLWHRTLIRQGRVVYHLYAARTAEQLVRLEALEALGGTLWLATDDGSLGWAGRADEVLRRYEAEFRRPWSALYVCGPTVMIRACVEVLRSYTEAPIWAILEAPMACGYGVCRGCAVPVRTNPPSYRMICVDGPALSADEVDWSCLPSP
jgi:dihydroorotate dehydrogenase electron transfer subunit